ncbi:hypothetical protein PanWU01x14_146870 [Parasponia andersonii]|uniref:Uncharacterized protein n=1 Tax=Parasponia andersonii TaxID=3476 RepID=A0A2P5CJS7_PARAD|nr:hypothetical protein PanWU01x14_146870 [Parasponia andersonii]
MACSLVQLLVLSSRTAKSTENEMALNGHQKYGCGHKTKYHKISTLTPPPKCYAHRAPSRV